MSNKDREMTEPTKQQKRTWIAMAKRQQKMQKKDRKEMQRLTAILINALPKYLSLHYGNPTIGRESIILDGPGMARLTAAATLRALLETQKDWGK
jgi:hypothetical protein